MASIIVGASSSVTQAGVYGASTPSMVHQRTAAVADHAEVQPA